MYVAFRVGEGGNGAQIVVEHNQVLPRAVQGYGTVHHAAFRVEDRTVLDEWTKHLDSMGFNTSGYVNTMAKSTFSPFLIPTSAIYSGVNSLGLKISYPRI